MKILIDIGHPAHVHYFKNFINIMSKRNHSFKIIARDKEVTHKLLNSYKIDFINRGEGGGNFFYKFFYMLNANKLIYQEANEFNPDLFLSFASPYAGQVSKIKRKPHISFTDTEHAKLGNAVFSPFTNVIITPDCYKNNFGKKHLKFDSYMELCYLHPKYFNADKNVLKLLQINEDEKFVIIRFVSWDASHDLGQKGMDYETKLKLIKTISKYAKVFISSEGDMPSELEKYKIMIPPEKMHDALAFCSLFIGEGATMASECSVLGTPAIYINSLEVGYCTEQEEKYNLIFNYRTPIGIIEKAVEMLEDENLLENSKNNHSKMLSDKINVTDFMVWFIENYPKSKEIMQHRPEYQNKFK